MTSAPPKSAPSSHSVLVVGCGYLGRRVALAALERGQEVFVTTRRQARAAELHSVGLRPIVADWTIRSSLCSLPAVDLVLVAVSYDSTSAMSRYESQVGGLRNLLAALSTDASVCYISTTGVYHQTDGSWVDENSPARPTREGGRVHLQAEQLIRRRAGSANTILRLSGIYGPGRVPRAADVIAGRPIRSPEHGFLNLIHVDDATQAVLTAWDRPSQGLYVVSDDLPIPRGDFYREIARQCGVRDPTFTTPQSDAPVLMRSSSNKRIWNRKMKRDLVAKLRYPTFREGLTDVLRDIRTA